MRVKAVVIVLAALFAGCLSPTLPPNPAPEPSGWQLPVQAVPACRTSCGEPSFAIGPTGHIFVLGEAENILLKNDFSQVIYYSTDGRHFEARIREERARYLPLVPDFPPYSRSDALLAMRSDGRLYEVALARYPPNTVGGGIEVSWSDDEALHWNSTILLDPVRGSSAHEPDRPWLLFGAGETMYLAYGTFDGVWIARSTDGGTNWGMFSLAASIADRASFGSAGAPALLTDGSILIPATYGYHAPSQPGAQQRVIALISQDEGSTFIQRTVAQLGPDEGVDFFVQAAARTDGAVTVAWTQVPGGLRTATSTDGGATWSKPYAWDDNPSSGGGPWIATHGDQILLLWMSGYEPCALLVPQQEFDAGLRAQRQCWQEGTAQTKSTDFMHAAAGTQGIVVGWANGETVHIAIWRPAKAA